MIELQRLKKNWEILGEEDPMWAILSKPSAKGGKWDPAVFFKKGTDDIKLLMEEIARLPFPLRRGVALDFGCGIGRLTQAMCKYFDRCYGIDISSTMLAGAARYNRFGNACRYLLNSAADLRWFANDTFDFIYSHLVIQHIPPAASQQYVAEFVRILKGGGLIIFQAPSEQSRDATGGGMSAGMPPEPIAAVVPAEDVSAPQFNDHADLIEMHALPRDQVEIVVRNSGGTFVRVEDYNPAGSEWISYRYWVTKPRM